MLSAETFYVQALKRHVHIKFCSKASPPLQGIPLGSFACATSLNKGDLTKVQAFAKLDTVVKPIV